MRTVRTIVTAAALTLGAGSAMATPPQYTIVDIGVVGADTASQGFRISSGGVAVGRSLGSGVTHAYSWTQGGGLFSLPNLAAPVRNFGVASGANDAGTVVGVGATTSFGSNKLPLQWQNGVVSQLPLPAGYTGGDANDVNNAGLAVGSVGSGSGQRAAYYLGGVGTALTATTPGGAQSNTLFSVNAGGRAVGSAIDPNNAARNVGFAVDIATNIAFEVGALPGKNGAICFDISDAGHIVGSSMLNQGSGLPFLWTQAGGMIEIPLQAGTTQAIARGVNSLGWVVGNGGAATSVPWLYDGAQTYRLADLLLPGSGWDLLTGTSNAAQGISEDGVIVGTGLHNGQVHAFAMIPVPTPGSLGLLLLAGVAPMRRRR